MPRRKNSSFEYACFISYRHGQGQLMPAFIEQLTIALENQLGVRGLKLKVFVDKKRLKPSYFFDPDLANAICRSVCMIVVYNNGYFDKFNSFCAKEFLAMTELENQRLGPEGPSRKKNLIIPIIIRRPEKIPDEINRRHPIDFTDFFIDPEKQIKLFDLQKKLSGRSTLELAYPQQMEQIAELIDDMYHVLTSSDIDWCINCESFDFPETKEVDKLLRKTATYTPVFPIGVVKP